MSDINRFTTLVLVPAYNAAPFLPQLIERIKGYVCLDNLLIVNDGSTDDTELILHRYGVKHIIFPRNRGKGAALQAGFDYALKRGYRSVLTLDADLQHLPEEIPRFFALDDGKRILIGTRRMTLKQMPIHRWLTNNLTSLIISIFSTQRIRDSQSGFRLVPTELFRLLQLKTVNYDYESEMLFKAGALGFRIDEVPISTVYAGSHSYINPLVDTGRFIRQIFKRVWY